MTIYLPTLLAALVAVAVAAALTPVARRVASLLGAVDAPGGRRVHVASTPRMGGIAVIIAYLTALAVVWAKGFFPFWQGPMVGRSVGGFLAGGVLIALVGAVDDVRALGARRKLLAQVVAASIAWWFGARIESLDLPVLGTLHFAPPLSYLLSLMWILAFVNAINLIDGLDGLAGGLVLFASLTNTIIAFVSHNALAALLNASLCGAVLGFLFYNFNPATIFLGDTGSLFLGYSLGTAALLSGRQKESTVASLLVPMLALGLPLTDTLFAMVRRFAARRPIFSADRGHIHHRLLDLGLTHRRAVLVLYGCTGLLCLTALAVSFGKEWQVGAALAGALLTLVAMARFAGYFEVALMRRARHRAYLLSAPTEALRRALPAFLVESTGAKNPAGVWSALERVLDSGYFAYAEYLPHGESAPAWRWEPHTAHARKEGKLIESDFPLRLFPGAAAGVVRFGCLSDESDLAVHSEILLQIIADAVESSLTRLHVHRPASMLRPVAAPDAEA